MGFGEAYIPLGWSNHAGEISLLLSHFFFGWGIYLFPRNDRSRLLRTRQAIDFLVIVISSSLLLWMFWINPLLTRVSFEIGDVVLTSVFLLSDLILVVALILLLVRSQSIQPRTPLVFLGLAVVAMLLADVSFSLELGIDLVQASSIADYLYLLAVILAGIGAAVQARAVQHPLSPPSSGHCVDCLVGRLGIGLPPLLLCVTYIVMIVTHTNATAIESYFMAGGIGTMFILVSVHQVLTLLENGALTRALRAELSERQSTQEELQAANATLEQHVIERTNELLALNEQLRTNESQLRFDAFHDKLTGLPNRTAFIHHLEGALQAFRNDVTYRFAVLFLDFDGFKVVNDSLGHWLGDEFLIALARRIKEKIPIGNFAARLGGDEFVLLLENILNEAEVLAIANQLQDELRQPFEIRGYHLYTTASIGIVMNDEFHQTAGDLLRDADIAMYQAKENGKARCVVFDETMRARAMARLKLETALRNALMRQELTVAYQPIWDIATDRVIGFEALARWHHADYGVISPAKFIPIAEETGLIMLLGEWILEEACRQLKQWQASYPQAAPLTISVNISAHQLYQGDLVAVIQRILQRTTLAVEALRLEITESVLMEDIEVAIETCTQLRELGVRLQIDDFGTGYSSFNYLHRLPIDTMKIDKSFIDLVKPDGQHCEIVRTIATLAQSLQLTIIAEGVETQEQFDYIAALNCEQVQGYFISKPLAPAAAESFICTSLMSAGMSPAKLAYHTPKKRALFHTPVAIAARQ